MIENQQILDDVQAIRDEIDPPYRRRYNIVAKGDHIRLIHDADVEHIYAHPARLLRQRGYEIRGIDFDQKIVVFEPQGETDE